MNKKKPEHPIQPLQRDADGVLRFKPNAIVQYLLDRGPITMNALAGMDFPREDREQFAQLIGYSLSGFGELSYVRNKTYQRAADTASTSDAHDDDDERDH